MGATSERFQRNLQALIETCEELGIPLAEEKVVGLATTLELASY